MNDEIQYILDHLRHRVTIEHVEGDGPLIDMGIPAEEIERMKSKPKWKKSERKNAAARAKWKEECVKLKAVIQPGDELWYFCIDGEFLNAAGGYVAVRDGTVVAQLTSWRS